MYYFSFDKLKNLIHTLLKLKCPNISFKLCTIIKLYSSYRYDISRIVIEKFVSTGEQSDLLRKIISKREFGCICDDDKIYHLLRIDNNKQTASKGNRDIVIGQLIKKNFYMIRFFYEIWMQPRCCGFYCLSFRYIYKHRIK